MTRKNTLPAMALGLALALGACNGSDEGSSDDQESSEDGGNEAAAAEAAAHDPNGYMIDQTGRLGNELGAKGVTPFNERLAAHHAETGDAIHVLIVTRGSNDDINISAEAAMEESGADAMIYVVARDEEIAVGGAGVTHDEGSEIAVNMANAFDREDFENGFNNGIDALIEAMNN